VRLSTLTVSTFFAGGIAEVSPQNETGVADAGERETRGDGEREADGEGEGGRDADGRVVGGAGAIETGTPDEAVTGSGAGVGEHPAMISTTGRTRHRIDTTAGSRSRTRRST
jgi:hypothetical protein